MSPERYSSRRGADRIPQPVLSLGRNALVRYRHVGLAAPDVLLASYPKSGSTWLRFLLAGAITGEDVDFDSIRAISPAIGEHRGGRGILPAGGRLVKTHYLPRTLPGTKDPMVLYLVRDGRDVAVSYWHHARRRGLYAGDLDSFVARFTDGRFGPWGRWQDHVDAWSRYRTHSGRPSALVRYEDLLAAPAATVVSALGELGVTVDRAAVDRAVEANTPSAMRAKESSSTWLAEHSSTREISFVRSGTSGGWRETLDPATAAGFTSAAASTLRGLGYAVDADPPR